MDKLLEVLNDLNCISDTCAGALMHNKLTKTQAKQALITELCMAINSFAMLGIDTYMYVYNCTVAIEKLNKATNAEQVVKVCLDLNLWTAETMHELNEMEA